MKENTYVIIYVPKSCISGPLRLFWITSDIRFLEVGHPNNPFGKLFERVGRVLCSQPDWFMEARWDPPCMGNQPWGSLLQSDCLQVTGPGLQNGPR